jgi:hypothetical protein
MCTIAIDGMAIRSQLVPDNCDPSLVVGFEDLGFGANSTSRSKIAKEAVFFMAIGLTGHWKIPVAYALTCGLPACKQASICKNVMMKLHEIGIRVVAVVTDGLSSNISMYKQFGCSFEPDNMRTTFLHPADSKPVYALFDACHQLTLMRNAFAVYGMIASPFFGNAYWQHIVSLHNEQKREGVRAGNKLTVVHIEYENQKMKVCLAAQVFSASVANALQFLRMLKNKLFIDSEGTELFLKFINDLFDVLNSKSPSQKGMKGPINLHNLEQRIQFLEAATEILLSLRIGNSVPLSDTPRRLCCIGFAADCTSLKLMAKELLTEHYINYLLTYKLSQDHLETFFSAVRSGGGRNNNPNGLQLKYIIRALLSHCDTVLGIGTNVVEQDETVLLQRIRTSSAVSNNDISCNENSPYEIPVLTDSLSVFVNGVTEYISGFVVKRLLQTEDCSECREGLLSKEDINTQEFPATSPSLLHIKDLGGLHKPSSSVVTVVRCIESLLRAECNILQIQSKQTCNMNKLHSQVLRSISGKCFQELENHFRKTVTIQDNYISSHFTCLIKKICNCYVKIRTNHMCRLTNESNSKISIRKKLTKAILFANQ